MLSSELAGVIPGDRLITDPDLLGSYARDEAERASYAVPAAVVRPRTTAEVSAVTAFCAERGIPLVPRGAGTGLSGGANAMSGCIVLSLEAMNEIVCIDPEEMLAVVQPGVVNNDLRAACARSGLWYPPDPASARWSTIGGNVATNAGGVCCLKYGVTRDYVLGIEAVVGRGDVVRLGRRTTKGVAGYDLTSLFVGSEGTLGIITEVTLRLRGRQAAERTIVGYFDDLTAAAKAVLSVLSSGVTPSAVELMDGPCLRALDDWKQMGLAEGGNVLILARCDGPGPAGDEEAAVVRTCFESAGATWSVCSDDESEAEALFEARRLVYPALERHGQVLTEDICVPRKLLPEMLERIQGIALRNDVQIANLAHAGDGNLHPMMVVKPGNEVARLRGHRALEEVVDEAIALGGTVTGEHGVGLLKMRGLAAEVGPTVLSMHRAVKDALDPAHIFNPGKIFE